MKFHSFALSLLTLALSATTLVAQQPAKKTTAKSPSKEMTKPASTAAEKEAAKKEKLASDKIIVTFKNDTVYKNGVAQFKFNIRTARTDTASKIVTIYTEEKKMEVMLSMLPQHDTTRFSARFFSINKGYDCFYPRIGVETILESFVKNGIVRKGGLTDSLGLFAYLKDRGIPVRELPRRATARPGQDPKRDSLMTARAKDRMAKQFSLTLVNKSAADVMIFLGDTASGNSAKNGGMAFRQGRYETVGAGVEKKLIGFEGEYISITDEKHVLYDSKKLSKQVTHMTVQADGKKLGE